MAAFRRWRRQLEPGQEVLRGSELERCGAVGPNVLIKRGGSTIATTENDGAYSDNLGRNASGNYTYEVCETDQSACSDPVTVGF